MLLGFLWKQKHTQKKRHVLQKWTFGDEKKMIVHQVPSWIRVVLDFLGGYTP